MRLPLRALMLLGLGILGLASWFTLKPQGPDRQIHNLLKKLDRLADMERPLSVLECAQRAERISGLFASKVELDFLEVGLRVDHPQDVRQLAFQAFQQCQRINFRVSGVDIRREEQSPNHVSAGCTVQVEILTAGEVDKETSEALIEFTLEEDQWKISKVQSVYPFDRPDIGIRLKEVDR